MSSVIILNYNGEKFLDNCLKSVLATDYPNFEVIVVDNNSKDRSLEVLRDFKLLFKAKNIPFAIIENSENLGFAEGNNVGARVAKGEYIVFLNNDTLVHKDWLKELVNILVEHSGIGGAQSKIISMENSNLIDCAGGFLNTYGLAVERGSGEEDHGQYDKVDDIFFAKGAAAIFRKNLFDYFGGFDGDYFIYHEEADLCWKIRLGGYRIVFAPKSVVYHFGGASAKKVDILVMFNQEKNRMCTLIKNYSYNNLIKYLSLLISLEILQMVFFIFVRRLEEAKAIFRALTWNLLNLKKTFTKRINVQQNFRKVPDQNVLKIMKKTSLQYALQKFLMLR
ncbi:MAG: glycosyltransferase family 2 protein [Candidatus Freyarchaeota archaeon]